MRATRAGPWSKLIYTNATVSKTLKTGDSLIIFRAPSDHVIFSRVFNRNWNQNGAHEANDPAAFIEERASSCQWRTHRRGYH